MGFKKVNGDDAYNTLLGNSSNKWPTRNNENRLEPVCKPKLSPSFKLIPEEPIFTIGSCFARNVESALLNNGYKVPCLDFNVPQEEVWSGKGNRSAGILNKYTPFSMLNEINFAFDTGNARQAEDYLIKTEENKVFDLQLHSNQTVELSRGIQRRKEVKKLYRNSIEKCRVIVITLGLVESWWDEESQIYLNESPRRTLVKQYPNRFYFEVLSYEKILLCVEEIIEKLNYYHGTGLKIILTVSPVPFQRTFTNKDVIVANMYSKSVLRTVAEVVSNQHTGVDYFPSYESIMLSERNITWQDDLVHVKPEMVRTNINNMLKYYS